MAEKKLTFYLWASDALGSYELRDVSTDDFIREATYEEVALWNALLVAERCLVEHVFNCPHDLSKMQTISKGCVIKGVCES